MIDEMMAYEMSELTATLVNTMNELKQRMAVMTRQAEYVKDVATNEERLAMLKEFKEAYDDYWECERAFQAAAAFDQIENSNGCVVQ
jgi:hypothetical protein